MLQFNQAQMEVLTMQTIHQERITNHLKSIKHNVESVLYWVDQLEKYPNAYKNSETIRVAYMLNGIRYMRKWALGLKKLYMEEQNAKIG